MTRVRWTPANSCTRLCQGCLLGHPGAHLFRTLLRVAGSRVECESCGRFG